MGNGRRGNAGKPYAARTTLGWSLLGPRQENNKCLWSDSCQEIAVNYVKVSDTLLTKQIDCLRRLDDVPSYRKNILLSKEEHYALHLLKQSKKVVKGCYQFALPWKPGAPRLIDSYQQAAIRLSHLKQCMERNPLLKEKYVSVMETYIARGHAQLASSESNAVSGWFLPHHAVLHQHKPEKLRVVFDCAARFGGTSLNDQLSKGPDFLNSLIGVLTRFRTEKVAVIGDIEQMFHQVFVDSKNRRYLRFLWWSQGDLSVDPQIYHMNVHLFGATSSPCCTQFASLESVNNQSSQFDFRA